MPPLKLSDSPLEAVNAEELVWVITLPLLVDAVNDIAPLALIAALKAIVVPDSVRVPKLSLLVPVVMAPASVTDKLSEAVNVPS